MNILIHLCLEAKRETYEKFLNNKDEININKIQEV
jgi:hypothetical protein